MKKNALTLKNQRVLARWNKQKGFLYLATVVADKEQTDNCDILYDDNDRDAVSKCNMYPVTSYEL